MAIIQKNRKAILHTIEIGLFDRSIYVKPYKPKKKWDDIKIGTQKEIKKEKKTK